MRAVQMLVTCIVALTITTAANAHHMFLCVHKAHAPLWARLPPPPATDLAQHALPRF